MSTATRSRIGMPRELVAAVNAENAVIERRVVHAEERLFAGRIAATARAVARALQDDRDMDAVQMTAAIAYAAARRLRQLDMEEVA